MQELYNTLQAYGYTDEIVYRDNLLKVSKNATTLSPDSLFFVDTAYRIVHTFVFAISAPKYDTKGLLKLDLMQYHALGTSGFAEKFAIEIKTQYDNIRIDREYGMRKIYPENFDARRYILRVGFPNFPSCPYGHSFKMLGYDTQTQEYVRFHKKILKNDTLKKETYKENEW